MTLVQGGFMATTKKRSTPGSKSARASQVDAISLLKQDHEKVRGLLAQVDTELSIHTQIEEEIFYPAFRDAVRSKDDKKMYYEAKEEHHVVKLVLPEVKEGDTVAGEEFAAKAKVLKELVEHHAGEEEKEMFPRARKVLGKNALRELGDRMQERKQELLGELG